MQNQATKSLSFNSYQPINQPNSPKALDGSPQNVSSNGASQSGPADLQSWLQQAQAWMNWYQGVMSGKVPLQAGEKQPTPTEFSQMQQWYSWALSQNSGSNWDPSAQGSPSPMGTQALPAGSKIGPMGNVVFNSEKAETTYQPSSMPIDVMSDEFTLNVGVKVKDVSVEKTQDTRLNPASDVLKITVKDPTSVPSETVYFVQPDAKININTIGGKGVTQNGTGALKLADGSTQITVGKYSEAAQSDSGTSESSMPGVEDKMNPGTFTYKPEFEGETVDFHALPGKDQTHIVWANANISARPGDSADATLDPSGDMKIVVSHDDGTKDTYVIKKGYNANLNINKEYMTFNGGTKRQDGKIPETIAPRLKVSGMTAATEPEKTSPFVLSPYIVASAIKFKDVVQPDIPAAPPVLHPVHGD